MPRRRPPRGFQERLVGAIESMIPGTLGGRVSNASPVVHSEVSAVTQGGVGTVGQGSGVDFYEDQFDLPVDGAQDLTLTYEPILYSEHVVLRGLRQRRGVDWTRDGRTVSILSAMGALTDDAVDVAYAYLSGAPVEPSNADIPSVPVARASTGVSHAGISSVTTPAFTPGAGALLIVTAHIYDGTGANSAITASDTLGGLTWAEVTTGYTTNGRGDNFKTSIFWAVAPSSPTSGTVTIAAGHGSMWITVGNVLEVASNFNPTTPIAQYATALYENSAGDGSTGHTLTATLASVPTGPVVAVLGQFYDDFGAVQPGDDPDFTHLDYFQGLSSLDIEVDASYAVGEQSVTWSGLTAGSASTGWTYWFNGLLVEIQ